MKKLLPVFVFLSMTLTQAQEKQVNLSLKAFPKTVTTA